jgi:L-aspartate oxidase
MLLVSKLIIAAAQARHESRGTHLRTDFPDTDPALARHQPLQST